jgi:hypothetical protein
MKFFEKISRSDNQGRTRGASENTNQIQKQELEEVANDDSSRVITMK